ncbi:hypothetical protein BGZ75_000807 [Mortierella antarctica]|nr:hypothetical protein BGZ75_000807 [Mortierella antarctica]
MSNLYYRKDIHKSIEGLLYGLFVYQYLLDTSTFGLVIRCLVQDQLLSLKSKAPTLRVALYTIFAVVLLAFLRHLHPPDRYAVIIDFIGNVSTPSRSRLLWLDLLIAALQVTEALIVFKFIKADSGEVRTATRSQLVASSGSSGSAALSTGSNSGSTARGASNRSHASTASPSGATLGSSRQRTTPGSHAATASSEQPSSTLFEYTPDSASNERIADQDERTAEYYVDEEEVRFSVDSDRRPSPHLSSEATRRPGAFGSGMDDGSGSESEESEDPFGDDYEEILQQETFVFQLSLEDLTSYLFSSQDAVAFPRPPDPRAGLAAAATSAQARNLPV